MASIQSSNMTLTQYKHFLRGCISARLSSLTLGAAGIGKTAVVRQLAAELDRPLVVIEGAYLQDETPLQGLPFAVNGKTEWLPPAAFDLPSNAIVFIDEITSSRAQHLLYQVLLERRIDRMHFPAGVDVIAAGNREEDAGSTWAMSPVLTNRVALCMEFAGPTAPEWVKWALTQKLNPAVVAAINFYPEWLHRFDPDRLRNPTPRSWHAASRLAEHLPLLPALETTVGTEAAHALEVIISQSKNILDPARILAGKAKPPKSLMVAYLTLCNLNRYGSSDSSVAEAENLLEFTHAVLQQHGESMAQVAIASVSKVEGMGKLPLYKTLVQTYKDFF